MAKREIGRLALREEGDFWNAYWAPRTDTMEGALLLGSIRLSVVKPNAEVYDLFVETMRKAFSGVVADITGHEPTWSDPRGAPETERSGRA